MGYTVVDAPSVLATHLSEVIKKNGAELLTRQETGGVLPEGELDNLESEITARNAAIDRNHREKENLYAKYERDKQRWRELKAAEREAERARAEAEKMAGKK
jgi:vacuolar-type H+-ATPase subunit I/STV1